ncbi:MAG: sulfite exporter TauE/SafE family protein [Flavobacteriia bacterium]|nr:sulfite exporter TauE/SafE family protein [Flavobacteriia bacterium]
MHIIGFIVTVLIGIVLGLVGGGGSILTLPVLNYFFEIPMVQATVYSLFMVAIASGIGVLKRKKTNDFAIREAIIFAIPSTIIAFSVRFFILPFIPDNIEIGSISTTKDSIMSLLLIIVMIITSIRMLFKKEVIQEPEKVSNTTILIYGGFTGLLAGIIGAGGGFIIVPALTKMGLSMRRAIGTSMLIITIQSIGALVGDLFNHQFSNGSINFSLLAFLTILTVSGVFIGTFLQNFFTGKILRKVFSYLLVFVSLFILYDRFMK